MQAGDARASAVMGWRTLVFAALAVAAGGALLAVLGAPMRMPILHGAALLMGLIGCVAMGAARNNEWAGRAGDIALIGAAVLVPLTALIGPQADGVARWIVVGVLTLQPAMIVVAPIAVGVALRPSTARSAAAAIAALGLAIQPDPGAAAMLLAGLAAPLAIGQRQAANIAATVIAAVALAVAQARTVSLPPVEFVEGVIPAALNAGILPALLALTAIVLMLIPAWPPRPPQLAFLGVWSAALGMALLGPYPTPVIGFGGSSVLGFILSAGLVAGAGRALRRRESGLG